MLDVASPDTVAIEEKDRHAPGSLAETLLYLDGVTVSFDGFKASCGRSSAPTAQARRR